MGARTRLRGSDCFPIELVPPPPANAGRGAAKLLDLVRPLSDCIEKRLVGWFAIARTGRTRYVAHRVWPAVDSRGTWGRSAVLISACIQALSAGPTPMEATLQTAGKILNSSILSSRCAGEA